MRVPILFLTGLLLGGVAEARDSYVQGYTRSNGTYVQGYHRTTPDNTINNNYGTQGNLNPYTGQSGTINPKPQQPQGTYNPGNGLGTQPKHRNPYSFGSGN